MFCFTIIGVTLVSPNASVFPSLSNKYIIVSDLKSAAMVKFLGSLQCPWFIESPFPSF